MEYHKKDLIIVLLIISFVGIYFFGIGITGKIILDTYTVSDFCSSNNECASNKICCLYNEERGICHEPEMCESIKNFIEEKPKREKTYSFDITLGVLILIAMLIAFYLLYKDKKILKKQVKKKIKKGKARKK